MDIELRRTDVGGFKKHCIYKQNYIYINTQLNTMMGVPIFCQFNGETEEKSVGIPHFFDLGRIREHILEYQLTMIYHI